MTKRSLIVAGLVSACSLIGSTNPIAAATNPAHGWAGVWQITSPSKAGGSITLADDGSVLTGVIAFNVRNHDTGQHIGIETRTMVGPHVHGDALVFQVRGILKPHMQGETPGPEDASDPRDIAEMTVTPASEGKATLACPKCGSAWPVDMVKEQ